MKSRWSILRIAPASRLVIAGGFTPVEPFRIEDHGSKGTGHWKKHFSEHGKEALACTSASFVVSGMMVTSSVTEATTVFNGVDESLDHFGSPEISIKRIQLI